MLFDCFPILYAPENNKPSEDTARQLLETSDIRNGARWSLAPCQYRLPRGMTKRGREGVMFLVYSRPTVALLLHYSPPPRNRIHAYTSESIGFFAKHTPNERPTDVFAKSKTNNVFYFILNTNIINVYNTSIIFFPSRLIDLVTLLFFRLFTFLTNARGSSPSPYGFSLFPACCTLLNRRRRGCGAPKAKYQLFPILRFS